MEFVSKADCGFPEHQLARPPIFPQYEQLSQLKGEKQQGQLPVSEPGWQRTMLCTRPQAFQR